MSDTACWHFNHKNPEKTSLTHTALAVYDDRGTQHKLTAYFSPCGGATAGLNYYDNYYQLNIMEGPRWLGSVQMYFDVSGRLAQVNEDNRASIQFDSGLGKPKIIALDVGDPANISGNSGQRGITVYASPATVSATADGHRALRLDASGGAVGEFTNFRISDLGNLDAPPSAPPAAPSAD